ncbi:hypothetical protein ABW21_db0203131 [Orbilia brochopaga]|nr:hypothetical protein ABW21_db0203131 [Drechslerella brochopaga]
MADRLPQEIWQQITKNLSFIDCQKGLRPVSKQMYTRFGNLFSGLPIHLWEKVFEHLGHKDLRVAITPACRTFNLVVKNSESKVIAATLFRERLKPDVLRGYIFISRHDLRIFTQQQVAVHPALKKIVLSLPSPAIQCGIVLEAEERRKLLESLPVPGENATRPPLVRMTVGLPDFRTTILIDKTLKIGPSAGQSTDETTNRGAKHVRRRSGVTVLDVMNAVLDIMAEYPATKIDSFTPARIQIGCGPHGHPLDDNPAADLVGFSKLRVSTRGPTPQLMGFQYSGEIVSAPCGLLVAPYIYNIRM